MQPLLVIMAAGMGSRYGGSKQIDPISKEGDIIMDFSLFDAYRAGFRRVVFLKRISKKLFANMWVSGPVRCTKLILSIRN